MSSPQCFTIGTGSVIAAILIAAFILHGLTPGPLMFKQQPRLVADVYAAMLCASVIMLAIGYLGQRVFAQIIKAPMRLIIPGVLLLCSIGAYMETGSIFSIYVMLAFAVVGFFVYTEPIDLLVLAGAVMIFAGNHYALPREAR